MLRSMFGNFRPAAVQDGPWMGAISLKDMKSWWDAHYPAYQQATGASAPGAPKAPAPAPVPRPAPPATILGMSSGTVLIGGAVLLGAGVVIAVVASRR